MSIASNLRREMDANAVTVSAIAEAIGAEPSTVRRYLNGKSRPNDAVLNRLAQYFGCDESALKYGQQRSTCGKLTTADVARATGIDPLSLRIGLQRGFWKFGIAYKRDGSTQYSYEYDPAAVRQWIEDRKALNKKEG